jgi:hypothetical protein
MGHNDAAAASRKWPDAQPTWEPPDSIEVDLARRSRAARADNRAADRRDTEARVADLAANARDLAAMQRDADANKQMIGEPFTAAAHRAQRDREAAAADRISAADDRSRAQWDRKTAKDGRIRAADDRVAAMEDVAYLRDLLDEAEDNAEDLLVIGRAQGMLMKQHDVGSVEALLTVAMRAARDHKNLQSATLHIVSPDSD